MKSSLIVALSLFSTPALAVGYDCHGDNGSKVNKATLPNMVTVISPSIKFFQFITHVASKNGRVSLIGEKKYGGATNEEMWVDAGRLKGDRTGALSFQSEEFRCNWTSRYPPRQFTKGKTFV